MNPLKIIKYGKYLVSLDSWHLPLAMVKTLPLYKKQWCYSFACAIKIHQNM